MVRSVAPIVIVMLAVPAVAADATRSVDIEDFAYEPSPLYAETGDVITWTNRDTAPHTVTCDAGSCAFDSGELENGATFTGTLAGTGTQTYFCEFHSNMDGRIYVGTASPADADVAPVPGSLDAGRPPLLRFGGADLAPDLGKAVLRATIENRGAATANPSEVEFWTVNAQGNPVLAATGSTPALAPGASAVVSGTWSNAPPAGSFTVTIKADAANAIVEGVESNNLMSGTVAPGPI